LRRLRLAHGKRIREKRGRCRSRNALPKNHGPRGGAAAVIVHGGELIGAGRPFPAKDFMRVASAEECLSANQ
jgi:hypothetical protein